MKKNKNLIPVLSAVLVLVAAVLALIWIKYGKVQSFTSTSYAMGSYVQQTVYGKEPEAAAKAAEQAVTRLENLISWRIEDSDIAKLNTAAGTDWITVDKTTANLLQEALTAAQKSDGAFDPTVLPVTSLWDFGGSNQHLPKADELKRFVSFVDYNGLRVDTAAGTASLKSHGMAVDLGSLGKGAACDEAVAAYKKAGTQAGVIAVGGSVGVFGKKPGSKPWLLGVRDPASEENKSAAMGELSLTTGFVSTSGSYEKQFTEGGKTYHHLLNPKTGYPTENNLVSVTVVAKSGALSDILSTACFVLGREKAEVLLKDYGAQAIFIDKSNKVYITEGLKSSFRITSKPYELAK